ncbi:hypothetical protein [Neptunicella marina]|uniref:Uncharacterized protein n=1 Tax=Neptunicella marina TaxID=2125989 RepID=A0A8J6ISS8_9ALTE|nr:hypothetical protein [Neptunicella marina]MBC3764943.1 hypothetical protein [Neptunicella marina]
MTRIQTILNSPVMQEFKRNLRLQWLLLLVIAILGLSATKALFDKVETSKQTVSQQLTLLSRLKLAASVPLENTKIEVVDKLLMTHLERIPAVASSSIAEAKALEDVEKKIGILLKRKRINLLGSDLIELPSTNLWSVRLEIAGQLTPEDFIKFIEHFDINSENMRISSLQYSPKTSNSISIVIDILYKREANE